MNYQERQESLTPEDKKVLRKKIIATGIFAVVAILFLFFAHQYSGDQKDGVVSYAFIGIGVFIIGFIIYIARSAFMDISSGEKTIYTGIVSDKKKQTTTSTGNASTRNMSGKGSKIKHWYYIYIGDKKFEINFAEYNSVAVGDKIALHYAVKSQTILAIDMLQKQVESTTDGQLSGGDSQGVEKKEFPFSESDLKVLSRYRNVRLAKNAFILILSAMFTQAFVVLGFINWLFFIPAIIFICLVILALKWIVECISKLQKDKKEGIKVIVISSLQDKQTKSKDGNVKYYITTGYGTFQVDKAKYESVSPEETIYTFHGKHSDWFIGLHTAMSND